MAKLNDYQLSVLCAGAREEAEKDIRINQAEPRETSRLLTKYYKYNDEIAVEALLDLFQFWACYFTCGADTAFKIRDDYHNNLIEKLNAQCEANAARGLMAGAEYYAD